MTVADSVDATASYLEQMFKNYRNESLKVVQPTDCVSFGHISIESGSLASVTALSTDSIDATAFFLPCVRSMRNLSNPLRGFHLLIVEITPASAASLATKPKTVMADLDFNFPPANRLRQSFSARPATGENE